MNNATVYLTSLIITWSTSTTTKLLLVKNSRMTNNVNLCLVRERRFALTCQAAVDCGAQRICKKAAELSICLGQMEQSVERISGVRKAIAFRAIDQHWGWSMEIGGTGASKYFYFFTKSIYWLFDCWNFIVNLFSLVSTWIIRRQIWSMQSKLRWRRPV